MLCQTARASPGGPSPWWWGGEHARGQGLLERAQRATAAGEPAMGRLGRWEGQGVAGLGSCQGVPPTPVRDEVLGGSARARGGRRPRCMTHQMRVAAAAFALLATTGHATLANGATNNLAPTKHYVCEGADAGGYGGRCVEHLFKGLDLPNCQAACTPPPPPVNFSCTGATAAATKKVCAFVTQWNQAAQGDKVSLVCTPEEQCTIGGTKLGANSENGRVTDFGFQGDATMVNVLLRDNSGNLTTDRDRGGLMEIGRAGSLIGTNITFRNGFVRV